MNDNPTIASLQQEIVDLKSENADLRSRLGLNSKNSHNVYRLPSNRRCLLMNVFESLIQINQKQKINFTT